MELPYDEYTVTNWWNCLTILPILFVSKFWSALYKHNSLKTVSQCVCDAIRCRGSIHPWSLQLNAACCWRRQEWEYVFDFHNRVRECARSKHLTPRPNLALVAWAPHLARTYVYVLAAAVARGLKYRHWKDHISIQSVRSAADRIAPFQTDSRANCFQNHSIGHV